MKTIRPHSFLAPLFAALLLAPVCALAEKPIITFDAKEAAGSVSPLLFGANHRWVSDACGSADPKTGLTYPAVAEQIKDVGISMIRYPAGLLGNLFQWERAIGPRAQRGMQISGLVLTPVPLDSNFGPDEYGDLLERTGAVGNLLINCGTAAAADAANFVAYMTAPAGSPPVNGVDWAARRASNGHAAPYPVAYVEIGNEYEPFIQAMVDQNYWIKGEPVGFTAANNAEKISRLYAFGGSTRFTDQPAVQPTDWREPTSVSTGTSGQKFHARYAPVTIASETVAVNGVAWEPTSNFATAAADAKVYQLDAKSGAITFGDGQHGAIPPKGTKITVSYTSGPHDGFVDYYRAIKVANPAVKVCASIHDESFLRLMGGQHPYDGIQQHPYVIGNPRKDTATGVEDFFVQQAARTMKLGAQVQHTQELIKQHAGANAGNVGLILSEYGQLGTFPPYALHFARSQGQAVLNALCLRAWILNRVDAADRTCLTDYTFQPIPPALAAVQSSDAAAAEEAIKNPEASTSGDFALFGGPGPDTVVTPPALAIKLLRQNIGTVLLSCDVAHNPKVSSSKGDSVEALQTFATLDKERNACLVVINIDPLNDTTATIKPANFKPRGQAAISTLASPGINDENNPKTPTMVAIRHSTADAGQDGFELTFPKHSITAVRLTP